MIPMETSTSYEVNEASGTFCSQRRRPGIAKVGIFLIGFVVVSFLANIIYDKFNVSLKATVSEKDHQSSIISQASGKDVVANQFNNTAATIPQSTQPTSMPTNPVDSSYRKPDTTKEATKPATSSASTVNSPMSSVLFLIFCGGPSGMADMNAILDTWGARIERAVVMTNTPEMLPLERLSNLPRPWRVFITSTLDNGPDRQPLPFWRETIDLLFDELEQNEEGESPIDWIVRSDSDCWWNIPLFKQRISSHFENASEVMLPTDPSMMGQFYPLVDFDWVRGFSDSPSTEKNRDSGRNYYLSGGGGVIFTQASIRRLHSCLASDSLSIVDKGKEDVWTSKMAYACNVTLVRGTGMIQRGRRVKDKEISSYLAIHRVAGDGRKDMKHPSHYEQFISD